MSSLNDILVTIVTTPSSLLLLFASLAFFFVAVAGSIAGKIEPGKYGRIASGLIGIILLVISFGVNSSTIPPGSYQGTCENTYIQDDVLYSTCKSIDRRYVPTNLPNYKNCEEGINNINGSLTCGS
ncbi:MAG TPA: hypothetical protein VEK34_03735 [Methylocella sp.]|nr:hypothetical protein [Methylocella sp.]